MGMDGRIRVRLLSPGEAPVASAGTVLLRIGEGPDNGQPGWAAVRTLPETAIDRHDAACRCCSGRSALAETLGSLFAGRARMELPFFTDVLVQADPGRIHDLVIILGQDSLVSSRFLLETEK